MLELIQLFTSFFKLGAFSFGGGYAMIPLIESEIINKYGWLTNAEFVDIVAISEMTPGPIAINVATFLGYRVSGVLGSAVATLAVVLPSFFVMSLLMYIITKYEDSKYIDWALKGIRPIVLGLIASAAVTIGRGAVLGIKSVLIGALMFYLVGIRNKSGIGAIILSGILGVVLF